jgi:creatinine amidohydrolase/Fe(II)-dependent formamide hydrolase-like protein
VLQFGHEHAQIERLDRAKTVLILPGGILEQRGPYLPTASDGVFNRRRVNRRTEAR